MNQSASDNPADSLLTVTGRLRIPRSEFRFTYSRSSGPGGQNVNKVNTKVRLRWPVAASESLSPEVKQRFLERYRRRITSDGIFILTSQRFRDRRRNVDDCLEKLRELLRAVARRAPERKATKPSRRAKQRRLEQKRARATKKQLRQPPKHDQ